MPAPPGLYAAGKIQCRLPILCLHLGPQRAGTQIPINLLCGSAGTHFTSPSFECRALNQQGCWSVRVPGSERLAFAFCGPQVLLSLSLTSICFSVGGGASSSLIHDFLPRGPWSPRGDLRARLIPLRARCCLSVQNKGSPGEQFPKAYLSSLPCGHQQGQLLRAGTWLMVRMQRRRVLTRGNGTQLPVPGVIWHHVSSSLTRRFHSTWRVGSALFFSSAEGPYLT